MHRLVQADEEPVRHQVGRDTVDRVAPETFEVRASVAAVQREALHQQHLDEHVLRLPAFDQRRREAVEEGLQLGHVAALEVAPGPVVGAVELEDAEAEVFGRRRGRWSACRLLGLHPRDDAADALLADFGDCGVSVPMSCSAAGSGNCTIMKRRSPGLRGSIRALHGLW